MALVETLKIGTELTLVPEPRNPMDRNAILIYVSGDLENDIGYLDHSRAKNVARMMECGATFSAEVYWIDRTRRDFPKFYIYIYHLTPMTRSRRPVRKGVSAYNPALRVSKKDPEIPSLEAPESLLAAFQRRIGTFL
jgi:hypothetical protein